MHTGDLGVIDRAGYGRIEGRASDMVIRGGENIYPREIEDFLHRHPGVRDDGEPIPPPRSIDAIKADPELADWREGADLVLIPLLLDRGSSRRVNISLDRGLLEAIDDEARQRHMTRSAFLASAARREIEGT